MSTPSPSWSSEPSSGRLNASIGIVAFVVIFGCVVFFIVLDLCLRYFTSRSIISTGTGAVNAAYNNLHNKGLDKEVIDSLPVFSGGSGAPVVECAVCISEVEDKEKGRLLPKCKHAFHAECIDMWFQSHVTCPICRSTVEAAPADPDSATSSVVLVIQDEEGTSAPGGVSSSQSFHHLTIDITAIGDGRTESTSGKAAAEQEIVKSPVAITLERLRSLHRLVSGGRRESSFAAASDQ